MTKTHIKLYIVEDYMLSRAICKHHLSDVQELEVIGDFETAEECLLAMEKEQANVILMDLGLPNMNGLEAIRILHKKYPNTKIIVLTSHNNDDEVIAAMACGALGYAIKDIDFSELAEVIKIVNRGIVWIDTRAAEAALSAFPQPKSTNFNELYKKEHTCIQLTEREREVLRLVIKGKSNPEIANEIFISPHTAKSHVCKILSKLGVEDRLQAAVKAIRYDLFSENDY